jgi:hypothetical protein
MEHAVCNNCATLLVYFHPLSTLPLGPSLLPILPSSLYLRDISGSTRGGRKTLSRFRISWPNGECLSVMCAVGASSSSCEHTERKNSYRTQTARFLRLVILNRDRLPSQLAARAVAQCPLHTASPPSRNVHLNFRSSVSFHQTPLAVTHTLIMTIPHLRVVSSLLFHMRHDPSISHTYIKRCYIYFYAFFLTTSSFICAPIFFSFAFVSFGFPSTRCTFRVSTSRFFYQIALESHFILIELLVHHVLDITSHTRSRVL